MSCAGRVTVLVIGGYGFFGQRLVRRLAANARLHVVIVGRDERAAQRLASGLQGAAGDRISAERVDATDVQLAAALRRIAPRVVVHTSGPFQGQSYHVAEACIAAGAHYIDLADGRDFVVGIAALDEAAKERDVLVVSGASSVPALSSAAVDALAQDLQRIDSIDIGISPGNKTERGLATVHAGLSYCGARIAGWRDGMAHAVIGWRGTVRYRYPEPVGARWLSYCDVPDLALFPVRYPSVRSVTFRAGVELAYLHFAMNAMALCRQAGWVADWSRYARQLKRAADWFNSIGSDAGGMHVEVHGIDLRGVPVHRRWVLVARDGDGPYVPTLASAALVRKLARGEIAARGAMPCMGLLALSDFTAEMTGLAIELTQSEA